MLNTKVLSSAACEVGVHHGRTVEAIGFRLAQGVDLTPRLLRKTPLNCVDCCIRTSDQSMSKRELTLRVAAINIVGLRYIGPDSSVVMKDCNPCELFGIGFMVGVVPSGVVLKRLGVKRRIGRSNHVGINNSDFFEDASRTAEDEKEPQSLMRRRSLGRVGRLGGSAEPASMRAIAFEQAFQGDFPSDFSLNTEESALRGAVPSML